jgi:hypothetical protein
LLQVIKDVLFNFRPLATAYADGQQHGGAPLPDTAEAVTPMEA